MGFPHGTPCDCGPDSGEIELQLDKLLCSVTPDPDIQILVKGESVG